MKPVKIAIFPAEQFTRYQRLLNALSELYSIQFESRAEGNWADCAAILFFGASREEIFRAASSGVRCIGFIKEPLVPAQSPDAGISFASISYVPQCFRGRTVPDKSIEQIRPLKADSGDEIVARKGEEILWIHRKLENASFDLLALDAPDLADGKYSYQFFQRDNCMRLLPLIRILRELSPWKRPPLRACLMFDDPNLHWKSYGYVRFQEVARHAAAHNYHASFATVPFDAWYVHPATAALFRENKNRLSLLIHGNNHTYAELAQSYANGQRHELMAQALQRIEQMEKRSDLDIPRVMAAPHGGCSVEMANALLQVGFEAASISRWSLMHYNPTYEWRPTVSLNIAEFLGGAFPIIPRFKLAEEREVDIYLAALLEKPIIMVGHHDDLRGGLDILKKFADRINSVGEVKWVDMKSMARSNFCTHENRDELHIKMYSRRINVQIPAHVKNIFVQRAWLKSDETETLQWNDETGLQTNNSYRGEAIPTKPNAEIEIASVFAGAIDPATVRSPRTSFWAAARRGFCEVRDRSKPTLNRLKISKRVVSQS